MWRHFTRWSNSGAACKQTFSESSLETFVRAISQIFQSIFGWTTLSIVPSSWTRVRSPDVGGLFHLSNLLFRETIKLWWTWAGLHYESTELLASPVLNIDAPRQWNCHSGIIAIVSHFMIHALHPRSQLVSFELASAWGPSSRLILHGQTGP